MNDSKNIKSIINIINYIQDPAKNFHLDENFVKVCMYFYNYVSISDKYIDQIYNYNNSVELYSRLNKYYDKILEDTTYANIDNNLLYLMCNSAVLVESYFNDRYKLFLSDVFDKSIDINSNIIKLASKINNQINKNLYHNFYPSESSTNNLFDSDIDNYYNSSKVIANIYLVGYLENSIIKNYYNDQKLDTITKIPNPHVPADHNTKFQFAATILSKVMSNCYNEIINNIIKNGTNDVEKNIQTLINQAKIEIMTIVISRIITCVVIKYYTDIYNIFITTLTTGVGTDIPAKAKIINEEIIQSMNEKSMNKIIKYK